MENIATHIVVTDDNREELEKLYGKIPPDNELPEAPRTHSLEEAQAKSLDRFNEREEVANDKISEQNL
jgi:hypothetical protein